ncbi:AMP-binding protein [Qingshengfaniella alkalisoli]|uniref:Long-chain-fatty-acid--CoA ligase n=1 Tax=Qingshengfaniella alkalisoli TaxID=2599296 RepID=A0A5B8J4B6_9RHOB|nr:class I adenylate-forming enzyme family protein [Qingshengfaniella alkalisoli]QDY71548.1 acyl--CoA ligase [Qingshengfaniella alkalisoli]
MLRSRLAGRPAEDLLAVTSTDRVTAGEVLGSGPARDMASDAVVLVSVEDPVALVRLLVALDGAVAGLLLVSTSQPPEIVTQLSEIAGCSVTVTDRTDLDGARTVADALGPLRAEAVQTRWMMTTSGTTGVPKIVPHTLDSLSRSVKDKAVNSPAVWGLVYELTRFAGLQVALQSLLGGGTLAAVDRHAPLAEQVAFLTAQGCTHLSATPTLWRRLLMAPGIEALPLRQVTLGGEIADQPVLDALATRFPRARLTHIYASTEAGVGFAVKDGRAGFPLSLCADEPGDVGIRIANDMLWLRPPGGHRPRYLGGQGIEIDADGFVNTGDRLDVTDDRALFLGRDSGVVNVGGVKVYPERVEHTIAEVDGVGLVAVTAKKSPITGALLIATVVPAAPDTDTDELKNRIQSHCRATLEREATPARIQFAETLPTNAAGKIKRS